MTSNLEAQSNLKSFRDSIIEDYFVKNDSPCREYKKENFKKERSYLMDELRKLEEKKTDLTNSELNKLEIDKFEVDKLLTEIEEKRRDIMKLCVEVENNILECSEYIFIGNN